ncbi:hypothetical protein HAZT_HAZT001077 [Hyalella azteca]|uniref:G-patch domain-containing protein n=1 Tax=Hyalella azteca TaxID=294128 RepID=A0A6A0GUL6_HYAAZ|nr:hypothetical protein HAZT_HAZT001077 [Hyalella azteca]
MTVADIFGLEISPCNNLISVFSDDEEVGPKLVTSKAQLGAMAGDSGGGRRNVMGSTLTVAKGGSNIGSWEKHTTGIGSKLLKSMGYKEGMGLGKNLQGISTPVEANKRKGKGAIGFYGSERSERSIKDYPVHDSDEEDKKKFEEELHHWRKSGDSNKKVKYLYKSADEVIKEGRNKKIRHIDDSHISKTKVIDMTGPETRVLSSYHAITGQKSLVASYEESRKQKYEKFDVPELIHNVQMLLEMSEEDIIKNARRKEQQSNRIVHIEHEKEQLDAVIAKEERELHTLDEALLLLEKLETRFSEKALTLDEVAQIFDKLHNEFREVYIGYELPYLGPHYLTALFKEALSTWNPLVNPTQHQHLFRFWQKLLEGTASNQGVLDQPMDPYHQLLHDTWFTAVRSTILGPWEPRDCGPLIALIEAWKPPLIPVWLCAQILQNVVLPRLTRAVHEWNPLVDAVPIHTWLHPWLPHLSDHMHTIYPVIRQKLASALVHWHPSDRSANLVLSPWVGVFSEVSMNSLLQSSIQPPLEKVLLELPINLHAQNLQPWYWFRDWEDILPVSSQLDILERCFFPRWFQALGTWLSSGPVHTEVVAWYKGWRDLIPSRIIGHPQIQQKFQQALEVSRRALSFQSGAGDQFGILISSLAKLVEAPPPPPPGSPPPSSPVASSSLTDEARVGTLRDITERRCAERGIVFVPLLDKTHMNRPVYRFSN